MRKGRLLKGKLLTIILGALMVLSISGGGGISNAIEWDVGIPPGSSGDISYNDSGEWSSSSPLTTDGTDVTASANFYAATYGSDKSVSDTELKYINSLSSNLQDQLDARCLESVFGTAIGTGLLLDSTTLKVSTGLQSLSGLSLSAGDMAVATGANAWSAVAASGTGAPLRAGSPTITTQVTISGTDPATIYDVSTATDVDYWAGAVSDNDGVADTSDLYQIGKGTVPGTTPLVTINKDGHAIFQNTTDSTTGFQVMDADGGTPIVNVDTTNERVGIGTASPSEELEVVGTIKGTEVIFGNEVIKEITTNVISIGTNNGGGCIGSGDCLNSILIGENIFTTGDNSDYNIAIGYEAEKESGDDTHDNVSIGYQAGYKSPQWTSKNINIGYKTNFNSKGWGNTYLGTEVASLGGYTSLGNQNVAIGYQAAMDIDGGTQNVLIGYQAAQNITSGGWNVGFGPNVLNGLTEGNYNVAIGSWAGGDITTGSNIVAIGDGALSSVIGGGDNIGIGTSVGSQLTSGSKNIFLGSYAGQYFYGGSNNIGIGYRAGRGDAGVDNKENNTIIGHQAGVGMTDGDNNIILGYQAGDNITTGSDNIIIGYDIDVPSGTSNNQLNIGNIIYGNLSTGKVGINTSAPQSLLDVQGAAGAAGILTLATKETTVVATDELGRINFNAPLEADGTDAILPGASIWAVAEDTFAADNNKTALVFATGASEAATEKVRINSAGGTQIRMMALETKTDDYVVTTSDLGKSLRMNSADDKNFTLPSVGTTEDGARLTFIKQGAGKMTITAVDADFIHDSSAAGTIYTTTNYATITIEYVHGMLRWVIISASGTFTTT